MRELLAFISFAVFAVATYKATSDAVTYHGIKTSVFMLLLACSLLASQLDELRAIRRALTDKKTGRRDA